MLKNKRIILIILAVLFLVVLFLIKKTSIFENKETYRADNQTAGLAYDATIGDLVASDIDGDGIPDWQEPLYGLDPTTKETVPGTPDITTLNKLKAQQGAETINRESPNTENLNQTEKFSRELFATTASLGQNGTINQATADQIGSSLADSIKNSVPRKVFLYPDIKITNDSGTKATKNYNDTLMNIFAKNKMPDYTAVNMLQGVMISENNIDASALAKLDPIIKSAKGIIDALTKMSVPESFASLHIDFLNGWERFMENLSDIKLYDTDPIMALGGISQYENNSTLLISAEKNLTDAIDQKINN